jgi:cell wall assembly regulator SMI1
MERASAPVLAALAPGASDAELDAVESGFGFPLPPELRLLWGWHNGVVDTVTEFDHMTLVPDGSKFLSAQFGLRAYRMYRGAMAQVAPRFDPPHNDPDCLFNPRWVPIFDGGAGGLFVCDCSTSTAPILYYESDLPQLVVPQAPSLGELVEWITDAYASGAWTLDNHGHWTWDSERIPKERRDSATHLF